MKNFTIIKHSCLTILLTGASLFQAKAQDFSFSVGHTMTKYDYKNAALNSNNYFKAGAGQSLRAGLEFSKPQSKIHSDVSLVYSQYNAVGNTETTAFNYQTDYMGLRLGIGPHLNFGPKLQLQTKVMVMAQTFVHGNQQLGNQYYNLKDYHEFTKLQMFVGYDLQLSHQVNDIMSGFVSVQGARTLHSSQKDMPVFDFSTRTIAIGIKFNAY